MKATEEAKTEGDPNTNGTAERKMVFGWTHQCSVANSPNLLEELQICYDDEGLVVILASLVR